MDIGAFEKGPPQSGPVFSVTTIDEHNDLTCSTDDCTLLEALNASNENENENTINFVPGLTGAIGTSIFTSSGLAITNPVTINGPGARTLSVTGRNAARVFRVTARDVTISGLGTINGKVTDADGGAIHNTGRLFLNDCSISDSMAAGTGNGGGAFNGAGAVLQLMGCTLKGNSAGVAGGGIYSDGVLSVTSSTFSANTARNGGDIFSAVAGGSERDRLA